MKSLRLFFAAAAFLLVSRGFLDARAVRLWSYQELLDKSDLVVIATPDATKDAKEHIDLPGFSGVPVVGVETAFTVDAVVKGGEALKELVLHHYRLDVAAKGFVGVINGPDFVAFDPVKKRQYLLFLVREADGRYAPAYGQIDPGTCGIYYLERGPG